MALLLTFLTFFTVDLYLPRPAQAIWTELKDSQIEEAIQYGKRYKNYDVDKFLGEWMVVWRKDADRVGLYTKFNLLAVAARNAALESRELRSEEIKNTMAKAEGKLSFELVLYGDTSHFARNYHAVLNYKERYIQPSFKHNPDAEPYGWRPMSPPIFRAFCSYEFTLTDIDPNAEVTLILIAPSGMERQAIFDLSRMR